MDPLFTCFNFLVELKVPGDTEKICSAEFSDCDGLEMTMEPKTIREGGNNHRPIHLAGPVSYGQLTLKRGMTRTFDLWDWFEDVLLDGGRGMRANGQVVMLAADKTPQVQFELTGCLPIKMRAPTLSAKEGQIAIEEMQIAYEMLYVTPLV
jgi:phage tail-like protein